MAFWVETFFVLVTLVVLLIAYYKWSYTYWKRRNLPYLEPSIPLGNMTDPLNNGINFMMRTNYDMLKSRKLKHGGIYLLAKPGYIPVDPNFIKRILTVDFQHFVSRGLPYNEKDEPVTANLLTLGGEKWKTIRTKLTPTFTSGKMKMMFDTVLDCGKPMIDYINGLSERKQPLNMKDIAARFTTDVIGSCSFGLDCESFFNSDTEYRKHSREVLLPSFRKSIIRFLQLGFPTLQKLLSLRQYDKGVNEFFVGTTRNVIEYRERNNYKRKDFAQLLMELKNQNGDERYSLSLEEMAAQSFIFFIAGFETSATTMSFCLHELSFNQDIQDKVREEIETVLENHNGKASYEALMEMKYLDRVIDETLRKYPPAPLIMRICNKRYIIKETGTVIEPGTSAFISVLGLHRDPEHYPEPDKFDPERFTEENKAKRHPFTYLPFGEGPRICIGLRFGIMQVKIGLFLLLKKFRFTPHSSTKYDMEFNRHTFILCFKENILLNAEKIVS